MNCPKCGKETKGREYGWNGNMQVKHCLIHWMVKPQDDGSFEWIEGRKARPSDSQRKKCYRAENTVAQGLLISVYDAQAYVTKIWDSSWFRLHYPLHKRKVRVAPLSGKFRGTVAGASYGGRIKVRPITNEMTILHELAHEVTDNGEAAHGPEFTRNFIKFVERWHSDKTAAAALRRAFRLGRVKVARGVANE